MSAVPARKVHGLPNPGSAPAHPTKSTKPALRVLPAPALSRSRVPFLLMCAALLGGALLIALFLNTAMAKGAYHAHDLEVQIARLAETEQALSEELSTAASPSQLAIAAKDLGMIPAPRSAFIDLEDQQVLGEPAEAKDE